MAAARQSPSSSSSFAPISRTSRRMKRLALIDYAVADGGRRVGRVGDAGAGRERQAGTARDGRLRRSTGAPGPRIGAGSRMQSDESGRDEVYVRDISRGGGRWHVSTNGGEEPYWSPDGRALYYRNESQLMSVAVDTRTTFEAKPPVVLFDGVYNLRIGHRHQLRRRTQGRPVSHDSPDRREHRVDLDRGHELVRRTPTPYVFSASIIACGLSAAMTRRFRVAR